MTLRLNNEQWDWNTFPQCDTLIEIRFPHVAYISGNKTFSNFLARSGIRTVYLNKTFADMLIRDSSGALDTVKFVTDTECAYPADPDDLDHPENLDDMGYEKALSRRVTQGWESICMHRKVQGCFPQFRKVRICFLGAFEHYTSQEFIECFPNCRFVRLDYDSWGDVDIDAVPEDFERVRQAVVNVLQANSQIYLRLGMQLSPLMSMVPLVLASRMTAAFL